MKFALSALVSALAVSSSSAFTPIRHPSRTAVPSSSSTTSLNYSVGIVGATGAVGKEIRQCLENRGKLAVDELRIFGSPRSAGTTVSTKYGDVEVELFSVDAARACDVVFLAVDGDFALEHAENICKGDDGAVVIDNSVCNAM
jgi:aspartate-semialdehyde dehydrogenase